MRALWYKPRGWWRFAIISLPGSQKWQRLGKQPLIHSPPSSVCVDTESTQERLPTAAWEGKFSLLNLVSSLGHMYPIVLLCTGKRRADSLGVVTWLLQEQKSTEQCLPRTGRGAVKESDNAWAKWKGNCNCHISAKLAQQRKKELPSLIRAQWASITGWARSSTCISHQTLLSLHPHHLLRSEEPFLPARLEWWLCRTSWSS